MAVALICGGISALVASEYRPIGDLLDEPSLRALGENPAIRILSGPPVALDDPGGFTVWRTGPAVSVLVSVWIMLAATRITRGEEDGRRWDLLVAGRLRMADVVVRCLAALAGSATLIGVAVAAGLLAARTEPTGALIYAAGITCVALTFATTALLAAQVMPRRSSATGLAVAALGVGLMLAAVGVGWLPSAAAAVGALSLPCIARPASPFGAGPKSPACRLPVVGGFLANVVVQTTNAIAAYFFLVGPPFSCSSAWS
ncbi:hypothetical protein BST20_14105 [Mycobacterium branderi]|nr:hypothetical protein BST20_14105 [Mycobacterium branderi]